MGRRRNKGLAPLLPGLRRIFRRLWPYMRRQRGLIGTSFVSLLFGVALRLLEPWPLKFIFDRVVAAAAPKRDRLAFKPGLESIDVGTLLMIAAAALVVITCLRAGAEYVTEVAFAKIGNRVLMAVRNDLFRHVQGLDLRFHTSARGGDLIIRVINDVNMLRDAAATAILPLVAKSLVLVGMWSVMFWLHWRLALLALATVPVLWLRTIRITGKIRDAARLQRERQGDMAAKASEAIGAIRVVQAFGLERALGRSFDESSEQTQKEDLKTARLSAGLERSVDMLLALATGLVLWYGAGLALRGQLTPGDLLIFLTYLRRAFNPVQDFAKYTGRLGKATAAGERVLELLDRPPRVYDLPGAQPAPAFRGHVRFEGVTFAYDPDRANVLEDLDLEARPGECVAIVGPSGIGKSTLANLLLRFYDAAAGRLVIDGRDTVVDELQILRDRLTSLARVRPEWEQRLGRLMHASERLAGEMPEPTLCGVHRDYYPDHVLMDGERTYLLDLDLYCESNPALDIENCAAHVTEYALRTLGSPGALCECEGAMLVRFALERGRAQLRGAEIFRALTLARHVQISTQFPDRTPFMEQILELCEQELRA